MRILIKQGKGLSNFGIANTYLFAFIEFENIDNVIFLPDDSLPLKGKKRGVFQKKLNT